MGPARPDGCTCAPVSHRKISQATKTFDLVSHARSCADVFRGTVDSKARVKATERRSYLRLEGPIAGISLVCQGLHTSDQVFGISMLCNSRRPHVNCSDMVSHLAQQHTLLHAPAVFSGCKARRRPNAGLKSDHKEKTKQVCTNSAFPCPAHTSSNRDCFAPRNPPADGHVHVPRCPQILLGSSNLPPSTSKDVHRRPARFAGRPADRSAGRWVGQSVGRSAGRSIGRFVGLTVGRSAGGQVGRSACDRPVGRSVGRPASRLVSVDRSDGGEPVGQSVDRRAVAQ